MKLQLDIDACEYRLVFDILEGEYRLILDHCTADGLIGHIHHVDRQGQHGFGCVQTPVGYVAGHVDPGELELLLPHWSVGLFLRSDVRYEQTSHRTTVVGSPARQAGQNQAFLHQLLALRDSSLPFYHPELPRAVGRALLDAQLVQEPALVNIYHFTDESCVAFGEVFDQD